MENTSVYIKVETGLYMSLTRVRDSKVLPVLTRLVPNTSSQRQGLKPDPVHLRYVGGQHVTYHHVKQIQINYKNYLTETSVNNYQREKRHFFPRKSIITPFYCVGKYSFDSLDRKQN
jgi:hypothetical protein